MRMLHMHIIISIIAKRLKFIWRVSFRENLFNVCDYNSPALQCQPTVVQNIRVWRTIFLLYRQPPQRTMFFIMPRYSMCVATCPR